MAAECVTSTAYRARGFLLQFLPKTWTFYFSYSLLLSSVIICHDLHLFPTQQARWQMEVVLQELGVVVNNSKWTTTNTHSRNWSLMWSFPGMFLKDGEFKNLWRAQIYFWRAACFGTILKQEFLTKSLRIHYLLAMKQTEILISLLPPGVFWNWNLQICFPNRKKKSEYTSLRKYDSVLTGGISFNQEAISEESWNLNQCDYFREICSLEESTLHSWLMGSEIGRIF